MRARWAQFSAELVRVPRLARAVSRLVRARLGARESLLTPLFARAASEPEAIALLVANRAMSFAELTACVETAAARMHHQGVEPGEVVAFFGTSSLDYVVSLLAVARVGATAALVPPELEGPSLGRALDGALARRVLVDPALEAIAADATTLPIESLAGASRPERHEPCHAELAGDGDGDFAYVFTSGTTGPSRPCRISRRRALVAATLFSELVHDLGPSDVVYCPLPLHHSSGLLLGLGACLNAGVPLALRAGFSANAFLDDVRRYRATVLLYVGELGRALLALPPSPRDREHELRLAVGNGMSADVWPRFQRRFGVSRVREFYAASEFPGAIVNLDGTVGSVGHLPFARLRGYRLVRVDPETGELVCDARGRALECDADEPGELVLRLRPRPGRPTGDYGGYVGPASSASEERLARDLFRAGDVYCRSRDLLRRDRAGHYWFLARLGDSFRFKGENVSASDVEHALSGAPGVGAVSAVGVEVPGIDGRPGLAVIVPDGELDLGSLARAARSLPPHARPCFVRVAAALDLGASLKVKKGELARQGVDPRSVADPLYFRAGDAYERLTPAAFARLARGEIRF